MIYKKSNYLAHTIAFLSLFFSIIEINAPIVVYGIQFVGFGLCISMAYLFRPFLSLKVIFISFLLTATILLLSLLQFSYLEYRGIFWSNTIRTLFWINSAIFLSGYFSQTLTHKEMLNVIKILIVIASLAVITQFISFYSLNLELDFSILLGGEGVRSAYTGSSNIVYRPTGLTSEPAIHCGIMMGLLTLYYILDNKSKIIPIIGLISILLTFSTLGIILSLSYLAIVYTKRISTILIGICLIIIASSFMMDNIINRYELFIAGNDTSNNVKHDIFEYFFSSIEFILSGLGFVGKDNNAPAFYEALYDMTYFFTVHIYFGLIIGSILLIITLILLLKSQFTTREKLLIILALVKLSGPTFMFFSFFIMSLFLFNTFRVKNKCEFSF